LEKKCESKEGKDDNQKRSRGHRNKKLAGGLGTWLKGQVEHLPVCMRP
jgi:hypothetical protein